MKMRVRVLTILAIAILLSSFTPCGTVPRPGSTPVVRWEQTPPSYDQLPLAETICGRVTHQSRANLSAAARAEGDAGVEHGRRRHSTFWQFVLIALLVLVCVLLMALASKAVTLCMLETLIRQHEREHGCRIRPDGPCGGRGPRRCKDEKPSDNQCGHAKDAPDDKEPPQDN